MSRDRPTRGRNASLGSRRATRRRRAVLRWTLRIGVLALVLAVIGGAVWVVRFSSVLDLRTIRVEVTAGQVNGTTATRVLTDAAVIKAAAAPLDAPLATLDVKAISARVSSLAPVAEVAISRRLPHTLLIKVQERSPAFVARHAGAYTLVDADGVAFHPITSPPKGLAVASVGSLDPRLLAGVATVLRALPDDLRNRVTGIAADTPEKITLTLDKSIKVIWGSSDDSAVKAQVAAVLLKVKDVTVVDVSAPGNPTTRTGS